MPYKNPEDRRKWELANKEKRSEDHKKYQKKYRSLNPDKIKENNKIVHGRRDDKRRKEKLLLDRIKEIKPVEVENSITKYCPRCKSKVTIKASHIICDECHTKYLVVPAPESRYSHGVRLKVATA